MATYRNFIVRVSLQRAPFLLSVLLMYGCETIHYRLEPPATDEGRLCTAQCAGVREMCIAAETQQAYFEQDQCERRIEYEYYRCMDRARKDKQKQKRCDRIGIGGFCWAFADTYRCEEGYRGCYASCGGTVTPVVEKW